MRKPNRRQRVLEFICDYYRKTEKPINVTAIAEKLDMNKGDVKHQLSGLMGDEKIKKYTGWGYYPVVREDRLYKIVNKAFKPIKEELIV